MELISEYYAQLKRQGIGSDEMTAKALSFIGTTTSDTRILDVGCGTGGQTMVIAQTVSGQITGLDALPRFIDIFNENAAKLKVQDRVSGIVGSMESLPFPNESLDVIWCEGAIYNVGFARGWREWRNYLKHDGYLAVTDASWLTEERPPAIEDYWRHHYPGITTVAQNVAIMQESGYVPVAVFTMPENCWTDNYFAPQISVQDAMLKKYHGNTVVKEFVEGCRHEERMYHDYNKYYGYVFYIGKKSA